MIRLRWRTKRIISRQQREPAGRNSRDEIESLGEIMWIDFGILYRFGFGTNAYKRDKDAIAILRDCENHTPTGAVMIDR